MGKMQKGKIIHRCEEERDDCCETRIALKTYTDGSVGTDWYMDDGEYYPSVRYCPYCGIELSSELVKSN